ncbi:ead/Ea22-like family protein [Salmonella enterica]|nr:ead/Ea22-like family protein [Salmonella enterica]
MNIDKQALREVAEKATKGPWSLFSDIDTKTFSIHTPRDKRCENVIKWGGFDCQPNAEANAEFIAAFNPKVALALLDENIQLQREKDAIEAVALALRDDMQQAREQLAALTAEPVSQTYELPELIEGMEVSIDVSTCDADAGNRYFGTVTEVSELDTAKNGYILLVQDAEPNFKTAGNSPAIPDGWISCSERMPDDGQHVIILCDGAFVLYAQYRDGEFFDVVRNGEEFFETHSRNVTDWMPLPEPPQEEK